MHQKQIAEEKKRKEEELQYKRQKMFEKFEKLAQKARYSKEEFYREVFTPNSLALLSIMKNYNNNFRFLINLFDI